MRISATIFVILISTYIVNASVLDPVIENVVHLKASNPPSGVAGIWKKKTIWKPRWVKDWKSAKVMKPVWKKVWSPVQIREWVPIPKPPPGWDSISTPLTALHSKPQKTVIKDSAGHDSFVSPATKTPHSFVSAATEAPLWDPVPYPESQQPPPPPPFPQPLPNADSCAAGDCDSSHSATFNHQQISEIIGPRYNTPEYFQNTDFAETVNHLTRLPPEGNSWRPPLQGFPTENRFNSFPGLPEFLVPPNTGLRLQLNQNPQQQFNIPVLTSQTGNEAQNSWISFPPEIKGQFTTKAPDHPYKFQFPEVEQPRNRTTAGQNELKAKSNVTDSFRPPADGDFIQEAHLVGEYHYSEFDLPNVKQEPKKPETSAEEKVRAKPQQKVKPTEPNVQKPKTHQPTGETKPRQNRIGTKQEGHHQQQNSQHVQKKHVNSFHPSNSFFQQEKAILKEVFPDFIPLGRNDSKTPQSHRFSLSFNDNKKQEAVEAAEPPKPKLQQQKENYPIYEIPQIEAVIPPNHRFAPPFIPEFKPLSTNRTVQQEKQPPVDVTPKIQTDFPSNHRFSSPPEDKLPKKPIRLNHYTTRLIPVAPDKDTKTEEPGRQGTVQLVFPTTPLASSEHNYNSAEDLQKTTTTEPFSVIFSSSLLSTTEAITRSPLVIVTPVTTVTHNDS